MIRPSARAPDEPRRKFTRGREHPRGVVWFGIRSFWGHLRHLLASGIATEDVDSRDWMTPDPPAELLRRIVRELGVESEAETLSEALGREVWIDYLADTGDDVAVSRAVARLVFAEYELPDPEREGEVLSAPRGDLLMFGGDTAYPVATAKEITNRVLVPFNQVLEEADDERPRVLLGIPGNHDWYDGLDGFGRLFRRRDRQDDDDGPRPSTVGIWRRPFEHYADWAKELVKGGYVSKPPLLALSGYVPVQTASYFALPLSPQLTLWAIDRQLKQLDFRQRRFFSEARDELPHGRLWLMLPDPVFAFGEPSRTGVGMVTSLQLDLDAEPHFVLSGDIHHYERLEDGPTLHVTAGGGGAFLHPACPDAPGRMRPTLSWPGPRASAALLRQVPWKVAVGRSGLIPHILLLALYGPVLTTVRELGIAPALPGLFVAWIGITVVFSLIGGLRSKRRGVIVALALLAAGAIVALPVAPAAAASSWPAAALLLLPTTLLGAFVFGAYLALLTRFGLEQTQAFTALDHPGFKHFLRLRVRPTGQVDGWCIGKQDPLSQEPPVLVDSFTFDPR